MKIGWKLGEDDQSTWKQANANFMDKISPLQKELDLAELVLPKIALQALFHESAFVINESMLQLKTEGKGWFNNGERHQGYLSRLDSLIAQTERYSVRPDMADHKDIVLRVLTDAKDVKILMAANADRFPADGEDIDYTTLPAKQINDLSDALVAAKESLKDSVDVIDPEIQKPGPELLEKKPSRSGGSGGSSYLFIHHTVYSSSSGNGASFSGGRGGFSAPTSSVSRGGFGSMGARMGGFSAGG